MPEDLAAGGVNQAGDGPQGGAFTGAIGTQQGHQLASLHRQIDAMQGRDAAVAHHQVAKLEQGRLGAVHVPPPR